VDLHGETLTAVTPLPVVVPGAPTPPPVLFASVGEKSLRMAGELADGTFPYLASPATLADSVVPTISAAAASAGRPAPRVVVVLPAVVTSDVEGVRERAAAHMAFYDDVPAAQISMRREGVAHAHELAVSATRRPWRRRSSATRRPAPPRCRSRTPTSARRRSRRARSP
jgi:alkanesulfonate monooxygenase SsuD/methylene tetrahydromethanopterin reductase-like flavin-dependent oxidoreductase (luciferase family)